MAAILGIAEHSGWAEFVTVGLRGPKPVLLERLRMALVDADLPHNPYHHEGLELPLAQAQALVTRVTRNAQETTRAALEGVRARHAVSGIAMQKSPYPRLPDTLVEVLQSYALTCAADGMLYRETLADTAGALDLKVVRYPRKTDPHGLAAEALGVGQGAVAALTADFGQTVGPPWRKEHRWAAAAALWVLARDHSLRL